MGNKGYTITKHGGLRSGLMFYADGNTRDGMVDMVSGAPGLIVGAGGSMVVRPETRGWAFEQAAGDSGLYFDTPAMKHLNKGDGLSVMLWGDLQQDDTPSLYVFDGNTPQQVISLDLAQGDGSFYAGGAMHFTSIGAINMGGVHQYLVTWKLNGDTRYYKDGALFEVDATTNLSPALAGNIVAFGNYGIGHRSELMGGNTFFGGALWNRELRADEALHLANDPLVLRRLCWRKKITNY